MKVILWMGMSVNGMVARENWKEDFISDDTWNAWVETLNKYGCVIWGRKTDEVVKSWPKRYAEDVKHIKKIVVSRNKSYSLSEGSQLVGSPEEALEKLESRGFKTAVLTGGGTLDTAFAKLDLINEVVLNIEPLIEGKGIPLFRSEDFELKLELVEMKQSKGKTIQLHYRVKTK